MNVFRLAQFIDSMHILLLHVGPDVESAVLEQTFSSQVHSELPRTICDKVNNE